MKKLFLSAIVALCSLAANAQVWLGGAIGFNYVDQDNGNEYSTFTISPQVGYDLNDKWGLGLEIETKIVSVNDGDNTTTFAISPFVRYTFAKTGIASFFVDGGFFVGTNNAEALGVKGDDQTMWGIGVRPGVKLTISNKVDFVASLGYLGYSDVENSRNTFGLNVNNNALSFGAVYKF